MEKLKNLIELHKKESILALFLLIVFIGFSATSAMNTAQHRTEEAASQSSQSEGEEMEASPNGDADEKAEAKLTDSQKSLIDNYDDKTKNLINILSTGVWSANGGKNTLRFYDTHYVETVNGKETSHTYAISRVDFGTNGSDTEIDSIVFETDAGTHIASYSLVVSADSKAAGESTISSSSMFQLKDKAYERTDVVKKIKVSGLNSEITKLLGDDTQKLTDELSDWCSTHYPVATTAVWSKHATLDFENGVVTTSFSIGDGASDTVTGANTPVVAVTYNRSDGTYSFEM